MEKIDLSRIEAIRSAAEKEKKNPTPPDLSVFSRERNYCLLRQSRPKLVEEGLRKQWISGNKADIQDSGQMISYPILYHYWGSLHARFKAEIVNFRSKGLSKRKT